LVSTEDFGITGDQYYWKNADAYGLTENELRAIGVITDEALVRAELRAPLLAADERFRQDGYRLHVKDGYRSHDLYELAYKKRVEKFGEHDTQRSLNVGRRPHASGFAVDVALVRLDNNEELEIRDKKDGVDAYFIGYYDDQGKSHPRASEFTKHQKYLRDTMMGIGWQLGKLNEIWHFEWPHRDLPS
jgi:D-alanyl-D-alanine dipeptidase